MKTVVLLSSLLVSSVLATTAAVAEGQFSGVSTKGNLSAWRINHGNGAVSLCSFEGHKNEPACYPWSSGGTAGAYQIIQGDDVLSTWRINASTGALSLCEYKDVTNPPICTPWSTQ
jgi:hypothetical protein